MLDTKLGLGDAPTTTTERGRSSGSSRREPISIPAGARFASAVTLDQGYQAVRWPAPYMLAPVVLPFGSRLVAWPFRWRPSSCHSAGRCTRDLAVQWGTGGLAVQVAPVDLALRWRRWALAGAELA